MNVNDLISSLSSGVARANNYHVFIPDPGGESERNDILCDSVTLPGRQIITNERFTSMKSHKMPYAYGNDEVNISFVCPGDYSQLLQLYIWQNSIITEMGSGAEGAQRVNLRESYVRDIQIHAYATGSNRPSWSVNLKNAFPTAVNSIEYGNGNEDVVRVTATFSYDDWDRYDPTT